MIANKKELLQAAQIAAAKCSAGEHLETAKAKVAAFESLGIPDTYFQEFGGYFDQAYGTYEALESQPIVLPEKITKQ
jgi:hypothetical protein